MNYPISIITRIFGKMTHDHTRHFFPVLYPSRNIKSRWFRPDANPLSGPSKLGACLFSVTRVCCCLFVPSLVFVWLLFPCLGRAAPLLFPLPPLPDIFLHHTESEYSLPPCWVSSSHRASSGYYLAPRQIISLPRATSDYFFALR